jgi:hypothetical protein
LKGNPDLTFGVLLAADLESAAHPLDYRSSRSIIANPKS